MWYSDMSKGEKMKPRKALKEFNRTAEGFSIDLRFGAGNNRDEVVGRFDKLSRTVIGLLGSSKSVENNRAIGTTMSHLCNLVLEAVIEPPLTDEQREEYIHKRAHYIDLMESDNLSPLNAGPTDTRALVTNKAKR